MQPAVAHSSGVDILEEVKQERAVLKFGVGDVQARLVDDATVVAKNVDIDLARPRPLASGAAKLTLDPFESVQQASRLERGFDLEHLVQEMRLITNANRLGVGDPRGAHHRDGRSGQSISCGLEGPGAGAGVAGKGEPHPAHAWR